jgi:hypothetical protein
MTSVIQDKEFIDSLFSRDLLEEAIMWMQKNLSPGDVFTEDQLHDWAIDNDYTEAGS